MSKIIQFSEYSTKEKSLFENNNVDKVKENVKKIQYRDIQNYLNSSEFKVFYNDSDMENILNGKIEKLPNTDKEKKDATYQLIQYIKNKKITTNMLDNIANFVIEIHDVYCASLLLKGTMKFHSELLKTDSDKVEEILNKWINYYNI